MKNTDNFGKLLYDRRYFIGQVYALLAFQVLITAGVTYYLRQHQDLEKEIHTYHWVWFILTLGLIFLLPFIDTLGFGHWAIKLAFLGCLSFLFGMMCIAASKSVTPEVITAALLSTLAIFVGMSILAVFLLSIGVKLNFLSYILFAALLAFVIALIVCSVIKVSDKTHKILLTIGIVLFSILIAYDTNTMIQPGSYATPVDASIGLYLDVMNIFTDFVGVR